MTDEKKPWRPDPSIIRMKDEPEPPLSPEEVARMEALSKEYEEIRDARISVLDEWNSLENSLVQLLRTIVGIPDPVAASILYFTPHSFRTRVDTISKLIEHTITSGAKDNQLKTDWINLAKKLTKRRDVRNLASHGHIITHSGQNGKNRVILAPVMMQMDSYLNAYRDGKLPGAPLHEVRDAIRLAHQLREKVEAYHEQLKLALGHR